MSEQPYNDGTDWLDLTQPIMPEDRTVPLMPLVPHDSEPETPRGASEAEFTQFATPAVAKEELMQVTVAVQPAVKPQVAAQPQPAARPIVKQRRKIDWRLILGALILLGGSGLMSVGLFVMVPIISHHIDSIGDLTTATPAPPATQTTIPPSPSPTPDLAILPWDGSQRFTILMMGLDKRPNETGTAFRTDSMMLVSIDPTTKNVGILSIPRDLFVDIPAGTVIKTSYGLQRINSAYTIGELVKPGLGAQLAMQTVQYNLGIRVNSYIVYDFNAVISAIDDIGGVDIDVATAIYDPQYPNMYYGYDPLYIPAGHIHMDGALALKYARTRHETDDLDRARRQQQILMAVRAKILDLNLAPALIARAPTLWNQLSTGVHSGLTLDQILQLAAYLQDIPKANIHQGIIDWGYVKSVVWNGADVLIPERAKIGPLLIKIFGSNYNQD